MKYFFTVSVLANIAVLVWALYVGISSDVELANKQEWSILEFLEYKYRDSPSEPDAILIKNYSNTGYDAAGIFDAKKTKRIWVLTNSKISPKIKLLPQITEITLSEKQVASILSGLDVNYEVKSFMSIKRH